MIPELEFMLKEYDDEPQVKKLLLQAVNLSDKKQKRLIKFIKKHIKKYKKKHNIK